MTAASFLRVRNELPSQFTPAPSSANGPHLGIDSDPVDRDNRWANILTIAKKVCFFAPASPSNSGEGRERGDGSDSTRCRHCRRIPRRWARSSIPKRTTICRPLPPSGRQNRPATPLTLRASAPFSVLRWPELSASHNTKRSAKAAYEQRVAFRAVESDYITYRWHQLLHRHR